jgi:uncharacterized protein
MAMNEAKTFNKTFSTDYNNFLAKELSVKPWQVENTVALLDEGATIPFIARYRKEKTGEMDDQTIRLLRDRLAYLRGLDEKRQSIYNSIVSLEKMTDEIEKSISHADTLSALEDIYRPYRPKRRTRASVAKEKGLEPLSDIILMCDSENDIKSLANEFVSEDKNVLNAEDALSGAMDIIAEKISDDATVRADLKDMYQKSAFVVSLGDEENDSVYKQYYSFRQEFSKIAPHRVLALNRGEKEGFLKVSLEVDENSAKSIIEKLYIKSESDSNESAKIIKNAIADSFKRLIHPSLEKELRNNLTDAANEGAIKLFGDNLRQLLLVPPVKGKVCLAIDPGYRTGCKIAVVDDTGKVLDTGVVYMTLPNHNLEKAKSQIKNLIEKYNVEIISIGNGTATKESEIFISQLLKESDRNINYRIVSEAGASVYSASELAANELPEYDVSLRGAISIARRLQDPLAELVKIDPRSIGVGQYQHDMPQKRLEESLDGVVEYCVNTVGVDLNTASAPLLERVSGLNKTTAKNVVNFREENGRFESRNQLLQVPKLGPKSYEMCAGFLRIPGAENKLDSSSVHPESYEAANRLLDILGYSIDDVGTDNIKNIYEDIKKAGEENIAKQLNIGLPTLHDIAVELVKPGRDMREELPSPLLRSDIMDIKDLKPGMKLKGTVRNVIDFGVFVDIGVHQDGLVHISQMSKSFVEHPSQLVKVGDVIDVWVLAIDEKGDRISLSMINPDRPKTQRKKKRDKKAVNKNRDFKNDVASLNKMFKVKSAKK